MTNKINILELNKYQLEASRTANYDGLGTSPLLYLTLGLTSESGEVAGKIKKLMRNHNGEMSEEIREAIKSELGDVLWYLSQLAKELNYSLQEVAEGNIAKLLSRLERGVIKSDGDNR